MVLTPDNATSIKLRGPTVPGAVPSTSSTASFVEGWDYVQTLGEGAYGDVELLVSKETGEGVACKMIDLNACDNPDDIRKEVCIMRILEHENVIRYFAHRDQDDIFYIFLEYCSGGELYDKIEPDVGMSKFEAQKYFKQLLAGLQYLHGKGIAHRDLKPENLLLDDKDQLKISDFGLATVFRYGTERLLNKRCGTPPYVAPEVLTADKFPYSAQPADVWSVGIILVAMLSGELPWDKPCDDDLGYLAWQERNVGINPWTRIDNLALSLISNILSVDVEKRATLADIAKHRWIRKRFSATERTSARKRGRVSKSSKKRGNSPLSQPMQRGHHSPDGGSQTARGSAVTCTGASATPRRASYCANPFGACGRMEPDSFSQPAKSDLHFLGSQSDGSQSQSQPECQGGHKIVDRLVRRMTRLLLVKKRRDSVNLTCDALDAIDCSYKMHNNGQVTATTYDGRVVFKCAFYDMDGCILVDFRLSKGDGLAFKRVFRQIQSRLQAFLSSSAVDWATKVSSVKKHTT